MSKRLRSMASQLWDFSPSPERPGSHHQDSVKSNELQLENEHLKQQVCNLQSEINELKLRASPPHNHGHHDGCVDLFAQGFNEPWISSLRPDVLGLPRLSAEILPKLLETGYCDGNIVFDIPKNPKATASQVIQHVERCVSRLSLKHPAVFKIGITGDPVARWQNKVYGYCHDRENWQGMKIMSVNATSFASALLESMLIARYLDTPGCRNRRSGGETASPFDGPHFTYVVFKLLVPPPTPPRVVSSAIKPASLS